MTMENQPFEDASPVKNGDFPASHVSFLVQMIGVTAGGTQISGNTLI